ncbi:MAG: amino acid racemase [Planctomycetota bacterium]|nr:amino acid racemase [Planctomycetota bacterium]
MKSKHIGIVGCSAEGAALCYRTICSEAKELMGEHMHPEITMHTHPLGEYMIGVRAGDWRQVADLMLSSAHKLKSCGADFALSPDNTIHEAYSMVAAESPIPWLHIADAVADKAQQLDLSCLAITGTSHLMTGPVYSETLEKLGIASKIPTEQQRANIDKIIFNELVYGVIKESSRLYFNEVIQELKERGCDGVVLGCTEIPLLVKPEDCPLPTLDSTRLLARLALQKALI